MTRSYTCETPGCFVDVLAEAQEFDQPSMVASAIIDADDEGQPLLCIACREDPPEGTDVYQRVVEQAGQVRLISRAEMSRREVRPLWTRRGLRWVAK